MRTLIVALLVLISTSSSAQENQQERPKASEVPYTMMQKLTPMLGHWDMVMEMSNDDGETWVKAAEHPVTITTRRRSLLIAEEPIETDAAGFQLETLFTYDQYRNLYRLAAIDDMWGLMDVYEGNIEGNALIVSNLKAGTFFPVGPNVWRGFRLKFELSSPKRMLLIDKTDDAGASWQPAFRVTYTKRPG